MNWVQFKDPVCHRCLAGDVVASWCLMQEVAGLSIFTVMSNIFVTEFAEFRAAQMVSSPNYQSIVIAVVFFYVHAST